MHPTHMCKAHEHVYKYTTYTEKMVRMGDFVSVSLHFYCSQHCLRLENPRVLRVVDGGLYCAVANELGPLVYIPPV